MSNSSSQTRHLISTGAVKTSGGNHFIAPGQLAVVDRRKGTSDGLAVVSDFSRYPKNDPRFILTVGEKEIANARTRGAHDSMSIPFSIDQIVEMGVEVPKIAQVKVDEWKVGYNGLDPETSFKFQEGMQPLHIRLKVGEGSIPYSGGNVNAEVVDLVYDFNSTNPYKTCNPIDPCTPIACKPIIEDIIKTFERHQIGGGRELKDVVEIYPILSCNNELGEVEYTTWQLSTCDTGDSLALANVKASVGNGNVILKRRSGSTSVYQVMVQGNTQPSDFTPTVAGMLPICNVCEDGSTPTTGGYLYYITVEDNGVDVSGDIESLISGSVANKQGNSYGKGVYSLVTTSEIDVQDLVDDLLSGDDLVATVREVGAIKSFCEATTLDPVEWTLIDTCYSDTRQFKITLGDDECGNDLLSQLQASYPTYNVTVANGVNTASLVTVTLSGTSGTANINIGGVNYLATFDTDLQTTAINFRDDHEATLQALGVSIVASGVSDILISGNTSVIGTVTVTNITTNLSGTVSTQLFPLPAKGACMTSYIATVPTDIKCEDCDPKLTAFYTPETPKPFRNVEWEEVSDTTPADLSCLCGIGFRGKIFKITPEKCLWGKFEYVEDSTSILVAGAGYASNGLLNAGMSFTENVAVKQTSEKISRDSVAGNLLNLEVEGGYYFQDRDTHFHETLKSRWVELESRFSDLDAQYVNYWIKVQHTKQSGYLEQMQSKPIIYNIFVEIGKHQDIETLLNSLAGSRGIDGVTAFVI